MDKLEKNSWGSRSTDEVAEEVVFALLPHQPMAQAPPPEVKPYPAPLVPAGSLRLVIYSTL